MQSLKTLYHLAEVSNLPSILEHGLLSTAELFARSGMTPPEQLVMRRCHRPACVTLPNGALIRDQKPMPPNALAAALDDGLSPADWYGLLNGFVFLWADRDRLERQRGACKGRPQAVLVFDAVALLRDFGRLARVSRINSGNARRRPVRRGLNTLVEFHTWSSNGWPDHRRGGTRPVAEVLVACAVPVRPPYLLRIECDGDAATPARTGCHSETVQLSAMHEPHPVSPGARRGCAATG